MPDPELSERLKRLLAATGEEVVAAYLFGSQARGTAGPRSDVDLGVLFREPPPAGLESFRLESELELALRRPVQVVILNRAPADLVHRVLRDGQILLDRDRSARIRFEVRSRNEYFDLEPVRQRYRRAPPR